MQLRRTLLSIIILASAFVHPQSASAIAGQFGLEFAIDAPWRLEPVPTQGGGYTYGPIPITVTFHDAIYDHSRSKTVNWLANNNPFLEIPLEQRHVGTLLFIDVNDGTPNTPPARVIPSNIREFERKQWISTKQQEPLHRRCRPHLGEDCQPLLDITMSHEWHAMFWYTPRTPITPGRDINLIIKVVTKYEGKERHWTNGLVVHAGERPLPRFTGEWLYGDFHYHSQMTDNDGESAYSYRNVIRTIGALGLDFLFTTEHASDGEQKYTRLSQYREYREGYEVGPTCNPKSLVPLPPGFECRLLAGDEARDLNSTRFFAAKEILYGPDGANEAIGRDIETGGLARYRFAGILPQIFMGEEVDARPEMSSLEYQSGSILYGDKQLYHWNDVSDCLKLSTQAFYAYFLQDKGFTYDSSKSINQLCSERYSQLLPGPRYLVLDNQGIPSLTIGPRPSRQHLVYFPLSGVADGNGFVSSRTGEYGGASRYLDDVIREIETKGVTFLAHPLSGAKPDSKEGPDIVPYSKVELDIAWKSPAVIGLQFWNENDRVKSDAPIAVKIVSVPNGDGTSSTQSVKMAMPVQENALSDGGKAYTNLLPFLTPWAMNHPWSWRAPAGDFPGQEKYAQLYHGAVTWDRYLRKGLNPIETALLAWLARDEPRKWFMASGSDSHGDFNYRRYGILCEREWCETSAGDTAIGSPRNLVSVGKPSGAPIPGQPPTNLRYTNMQVITALKEGKFSVTDGPALRISIDKNRDGKLTDGLDYSMGATFNLFPNEQIPVQLEWISTPEFGSIKRIDLYVGTQDGTYAPEGHGPPYTLVTESQLPNWVPTVPAYLITPGTRVLHIDLSSYSPEVRYHGLAKFYLNPAQFGITQQGKLFYVRAYAQTYGRMEALSGCTIGPLASGKCGDRHAYTNPVWGRYNNACSTTLIGLRGHQSIDSNNDGVPDTCGGVALTDLCGPLSKGIPILPGLQSCNTVIAFNEPPPVMISPPPTAAPSP